MTDTDYTVRVRFAEGQPFNCNQTNKFYEGGETYEMDAIYAKEGMLPPSAEILRMPTAENIKESLTSGVNHETQEIEAGVSIVAHQKGKIFTWVRRNKDQSFDGWVYEDDAEKRVVSHKKKAEATQYLTDNHPSLIESKQVKDDNLPPNHAEKGGSDPHADGSLPR